MFLRQEVLLTLVTLEGWNGKMKVHAVTKLKLLNFSIAIKRSFDVLLHVLGLIPVAEKDDFFGAVVKFFSEH